jgi:long-chain-acyl-CoA dehydrogenase
VSLFLVDTTLPGFERGRILDKVGQPESDTAELFFSDLRVPADALLGEVGQGFISLMQRLPQERIGVAIGNVSNAVQIFEETLEYVKQRQAFGQPIGSFQHNRFLLAEMDTQLDVCETYVDRCLQAVVDGELTAVEAAKAKWWCTETAKKVIDGCVQLHGGYGYMMEYRVARDYVDSRIQTIFGGTTEIMKDIIGRDLGL